MSSKSSTDDDARQLALVRQVYGPSADIYTDILHLSPTASAAEIRESFFCLRYDAYRRLESDGESMSPSERLKVEQTMDAIAAGFHIVGDPTRRMVYDKSRQQQQRQQRQQNHKVTTSTTSTTTTTDDLGFPVLNPVTGRPVARHKPPAAPSSSTAKAIATMNLAKGEIIDRRSKPVNVAGGINVRSSPLTKSTWTDFDEVEKARAGPSRSKSVHLLPTKSRHDNYSNGRSAAPPDMWGKKKKNTSPTSVITDLSDSKQASRKGNNSDVPTPRRLDDNAVPDEPSGDYDETSAPSHLDKTDDAIMDANLPVSMKPFSSNDETRLRKGAASPATTQYTLASDDTQVNDNTRRAPSPASRMLKNAASRMADAAAKEEVRRKKKAAIILKKLEEEEEKWTALASKIASRAGADITPSSSTIAARAGATLPKDDDRSTDDENTMDDDDRTNYDDETNTYDGNEETTMGDTTYADDTTMGEDTTFYDDTATMGSATYADDTTIGESTWASDYSDQDHPSSGGRHIPRHKQMKGNMPEPILKSTSRGKKGKGGVAGKNDDARHVTIHSHRGRGEDYEESCEIFEAGACPSISVIREELNGTYQDLTHTWKQVTSAFQISTDDIDRLADKLRDAKLELGEHYTRQVMDRSTAAGVGVGEMTTSTSKSTTTPDLSLLQQQKMWQISKKMFT